MLYYPLKSCSRLVGIMGFLVLIVFCCVLKESLTAAGDVPEGEEGDVPPVPKGTRMENGAAETTAGESPGGANAAPAEGEEASSGGAATGAPAAAAAAGEVSVAGSGSSGAAASEASEKPLLE